MSIFDDAKDLVTKGGKKVDPSQAVDEVKKLLDKAEDLEKKVDKGLDTIKDLPSEVKDEAKKIVNEAAKEFKKEFHDLVQSQIGKAFKSALEFAWQRVKKTKVLKSFGISVDLAIFTSMVGGGISISWDNIGDDKEILLKKIGSLSSSPPTSKEAIKDFIKVLAPDTVVFTVSAFSIGLGVDEAIDEVDTWCNKIGLS